MFSPLYELHVFTIVIKHICKIRKIEKIYENNILCQSNLSIFSLCMYTHVFIIVPSNCQVFPCHVLVQEGLDILLQYDTRVSLIMNRYIFFPMLTFLWWLDQDGHACISVSIIMISYFDTVNCFSFSFVKLIQH